MLRAAGYFAGVDCPFSNSNEGCSRPYCVFRHSGLGQTSTSDQSQTSVNDTPASLSAVNEAIAKLKSDLFSDSNNSVYTDGSNHTQVIDDYSPMLNETYTPAPYVLYDTEKSGSSLYTPCTKPGNRVISHHPLKKSVLHGARGASSMALKRKIRPQPKRNIYESSSKMKPASDMEYDPIMNYATATLDKCHNSYSGAVDASESSCEDDFAKSAEEDDIEDCLIIEEDKDDPGVDKELFGTDSDSDALYRPGPVLEKETVKNLSQGEQDSNFQTSSSPTTGKINSDTSNDKNNDVQIIEISDDSSTEAAQSASTNGSNKTSVLGKDTVQLPSHTEKRQKSKIPSKRKISTGENSTKSKQDGKSRKIDVSKKLNFKDKKEKDISKKKSGKATGVKKKIKKKSNTASADKTVINAKDIDESHIASLVDREEIKELEKELGGENRYEECLRIYQETKVAPVQTKASKPSSVAAVPSVSNETSTSPPVADKQSSLSGKQRIAHTNAAVSAVSLRKPLVTRKRISTPAQMMMRRQELIEKESACTSQSSSISGRIAHRPINSANLLTKRATNWAKSPHLSNVDKKVQQNPWFPKKETEPTVCGTATKGVSRVAHHGKVNATNQNGSALPTPPRIAVDRYSKVPTNIRQRYLTTYINECMRIFNDNHVKAYSMAQMEEEKCKTRSNTKNVYLSLAASALKKLRAMPTASDSSPASSMQKKGNHSAKVSYKKQATPSSSPARKKAKVISHNSLLDVNTKTCKGGYTIERKPDKSALTAVDLYEKMCKYIMTPEQLDENSYPRPGEVPGKAEFRCDPPMKPHNTTSRKICARCGREFVLNKNGTFDREEECIHHWGRPYMTRVGKGWEKRYSCCQERIGSEGCTVGDTHVHSENKLDRTGYVRTLMKSPPPDGNAGVYTLDCEMSYTVGGLELTRVSVLDHDCTVVYDTLVKPSGRVLDYNTRWSGITEDDMKGVMTTRRDVQAVFLSKFSADTILMGHSLESDLVALRIIHETVIDTAIVFPHKRGPPYKRALRNLASEHIGLIIQNVASEGHDSAEDASACMKLMLWKLSEDDKLSNKHRS